MAANSSFRRCSVTLISLRPLSGSKARSTLAIPLRSYSEVHTLWLAGFACKRLSHLGQQLAGPLVEAHYGSLRIVGFLVEVQDLFHPPHELGVVLGWDHPLLDQVRLEFVFLSVLRTVSCETFSTMPSSTALSASSLKDQPSRPRGGSEQARAIRCASARPSKERL
jgi:hypothetical protein